jgi:hypothetical protein
MYVWTVEIRNTTTNVYRIFSVYESEELAKQAAFVWPFSDVRVEKHEVLDEV